MESRRVIALFFVFLLLMLATIPPNGALSRNEEVFFTEALKAVAPERFHEPSAMREDRNTRLAFDIPMGLLIEATDPATAQMAGRLFNAALYAAALTALAVAAGMGLVDGVLMVMALFLVQRYTMGLEWLFSGVESKTIAYPCVLFAMARLMKARYAQAGLLLAAATYFHFLVGGFWALFLAVVAAWDQRSLKAPGLVLSVYIIAAAPQLYIILRDYADTLRPIASVDGLTADYIYTYLRIPHHAAPFKSMAVFSSWAPAIGLAAGLFLLMVGMVRHAVGPGRTLTRLAVTALAFVLFALLVSAVDHGGVTGKLYLFRPTHLAFMLCFAAILLFLSAWLRERSLVVKLALLLVLTPPFLARAAEEALGDWMKTRTLHRQQAAVEAYVLAETAPDALILIDPALEGDFMRFERATGRPTLVNERMVPTKPRALLDWHALLDYRERVFTQGCAALAVPPATREAPPGADYLLTRRKDAMLLHETCAAPAYEDASYILFPAAPAPPGSSAGSPD